MIDEVQRGELVETDLSRFIERRASKVPEDRPGQEAANALQAIWRASEERQAARERRERLWDRLGWHRAMIDSHTRNFEELLRRHRVGLRLCEEALGITTDEGEAA